MEKRNRSDLYRPAEFILNLAPLDSGEGIVKMLREGTDLTTVDGAFFTLVAKLSDGGNHRRRAAAPGLLEGAFVHGFFKLVNA